MTTEEFDLDYNSGDDDTELAPLSKRITTQRDALRAWVSQSRTTLGVAASRIAKGLAAAGGTAAHAPLSSEAAAAAGQQQQQQHHHHKSPLKEVLQELEEWLEVQFPAKLDVLKGDLQDALDDLRGSEEGRRTDVETLCEELEELEVAMNEVYDQAQNLHGRLETIQRLNEEQAVVAVQAQNQLLATKSMSSPPAPFTQQRAAASRTDGGKHRGGAATRGGSPNAGVGTRGSPRGRQAGGGGGAGALSLDDLLAQVEQQNLKHEALQAMDTHHGKGGGKGGGRVGGVSSSGGGGGGGGGGGSSSSPSTSASPTGSGGGAVGVEGLAHTILDKNPNVRKATEDVRTFFSAFGSKVKAATTDGLKHVRRAADDSKSQFARVRQQLQSMRVTPPVSPAATAGAVPSTSTARSPGSDVATTTTTTTAASCDNVNGRKATTAAAATAFAAAHTAAATTSASGGNGGRRPAPINFAAAIGAGSASAVPTAFATTASPVAGSGSSTPGSGRARPLPPPPPPVDEAEEPDIFQDCLAAGGAGSGAGVGDDDDDGYGGGTPPARVAREELNELLRGRGNDVAVYACLERVRRRRAVLHKRRQEQHAGQAEQGEATATTGDAGGRTAGEASATAKGGGATAARMSKVETDGRGGGTEKKEEAVGEAAAAAAAEEEKEEEEDDEEEEEAAGEEEEKEDEEEDEEEEEEEEEEEKPGEEAAAAAATAAQGAVDGKRAEQSSSKEQPGSPRVVSSRGGDEPAAGRGDTAEIAAAGDGSTGPAATHSPGGGDEVNTGDNHDGKEEEEGDDEDSPALFPAPLTHDAPLVVAVQHGRLEACRYIASQFYAGGARLDALAQPFPAVGVGVGVGGGADGAAGEGPEPTAATATAAKSITACKLTLLHLASLLPAPQLPVLTWLARAVWGGYADGPDVAGNAACCGGMSPALFACCAGNLPAVQLLVRDHGADVSVTAPAACGRGTGGGTTTDVGGSGSDGWTAAHCAAAGGHLAVLRWLAEQGHIRGARDAHGRTPLDVAVAAGHNDAAAFLCDQQ